MNINHERFTQATQDVINKAAQIATQYNHAALTPVHLLAATIEHNFTASLLQTMDIPQRNLQDSITKELNSLATVHGAQLALDHNSQQLLVATQAIAQELQDQYISIKHLLIAFVSTHYLPEDIKNSCLNAGLTKERIIEHTKDVETNNKMAEEQYKILEKYCINITEQAKSGKLDPVIGRHEEIRRVMQILSRRTKNNPVLIGQPGVGKTAIVEGIAQRIINNDVPESLKNKTIYSLDLGLLIAGAKYQGEFEERLKGVLKEIESKQEHIILFIDELHMLIGAGKTQGAMDASNLLKPALARGTLHCIGATTLQEYKQHIEKDAALERRFQKVLVPEPSLEDAISILRGIKEKFELHHGIHIKDQALINAVQLSAKNIGDRYLPDKAIDLVDEAAAMVKMSIDSQPEALDKLERMMRQLKIEKVALEKEKDTAAKKRLTKLEKELAELQEQYTQLHNQWKSEKEPLERINKIKEEIERATYQFQDAERNGDFAKASEIKYGTLSKLEQQLITEQDKVKNISQELIKQQVDEHDIAKVVARWTGIPAEKLKASEAEKLLSMESILKDRVIGQDEAISQVTHAIQLHRAGLADPNKPIGSFLFLGPTGVGKTEVAKTLAEFLFNDEKKLIRIDMSEYSERHSVARLIGAPPGYVGYEEGGQLTEQVRRNPYSVILFDEIEKAHPEVFNLFLPIFDEGHLTDGQGRTVSFKNCIIIMTSNIGSQIILDAKELTDKTKQSIDRLLHQSFRPELLNRIDATVFFRMLSQEDVESIAQIQVKQLAKRLQQQQIRLTVDTPTIKYLATTGFVKEFGARPLKRTIQQYIMVPASQHILKHPNRKTITVKMNDNKVVIE